MSTPLCHCTLLRKASRRISSYYDEALAPLGINVAQFSLLRNIAAKQPVSLTELAVRVELDRSTVGRNVKVLERLGLVAVGHGTDQREALLKLSQSGRARLDEGAPLWEGVQQRVERNIGSANMRQLRELLAAL